MSKKKIAVLLSSYNGEKYIEEQVKSVLKQEDVDVTLFIRDDGSTDNTINVLKKLCVSDNIKLFEKTNQGVVKSFFELIKVSHGFDYYSLCDQDDVWDSDKLKVAIQFLENDINQPGMYFSATRIVDSELNPLDNSVMISGPKALNLKQVLLTNNATGCTIVFNNTLRNILIKKFPEKVIMHDHWIYLICLALGGNVYYDKVPHINYRQHGNNVLGNKKSLKATLKYSSFSEMRGIRSYLACFLLDNFISLIPKANIEVLKCFADYKDSIRNKVNLVKLEWNNLPSYKRKLIFVVQAILEYI